MKIFFICTPKEAEKLLEYAKKVQGVNGYIQRPSVWPLAYQEKMKDRRDDVLVKFTTRSAVAMYQLGQIHGLNINDIFTCPNATRLCGDATR